MSRFLIWFFTCFLSTLGIAYLYLKIVKGTFKINFRIVFIFLSGVVFATLLRFYQLNFYSSFSYFVYIPFLFYTLKPFSFRNLFFYIIIIWLIGMCLDIISMLVISLLYSLFGFDVVNSDIFQIFPTILVFLMFVLFGNCSFLSRFVSYLFDVYRKINYLDFSIISFAIFLLIFSIILAMNVENLSVGVLLAFIIILITFHFFLLIKSKLSDIESKIFINTLKENNEFYISMEVENGIFKHNLMAKLLSIKSVSNQKSRQLIDDLIYSFNNNLDFTSHIQNIPYGLNGIIYQKLYPYLKLLNVKIDNKIDFDIFDVLMPRRYNVFVEKMVIALDNAIESSLGSREKLLIINLYSTETEVAIEIKNTFGSDLNIDNIGNLNYSTKGSKHGLGLFSALRNKEAQMNVKVINNLFTVKIFAKKKFNE